MERLLIIFLLLSIGFWSCNGKEETAEIVNYNGPLIESDSIKTLYSDSALVRVSVEAPKQYHYENGNQEFPVGIYIEFYEVNGTVSSTLKADKGYYFREPDRYTAVGNVVIEGKKENNRLDTDTLHWSPQTKRVFTKAKVKVVQEGDTLRGLGLEAAEDFSTYEVLNPEGTVKLEDNENEENN